MALPTITLFGNVVADPVLRFTNAGKPVTTLRVACNETRKNDAGVWETVSTVYLNVIAWSHAEDVANACTKGSRVLVTGILTQRTYTASDGNERITFEVKAHEIGYAPTGHSAYGTSNTPSEMPPNPWAESPF